MPIQNRVIDYTCVFQAKVATKYTPKLPPIPREGCHLIQSKAATPDRVI